MLTLIFETTRERAEALARVHLPKSVPMPRFRTAGRLVAVQSDFFALMGRGAIKDIATQYGLPLRSIIDRPPFSQHDKKRDSRVIQQRRDANPKQAVARLQALAASSKDN